MFLYITSCIASFIFGLLLGKAIADSRGFSKKQIEVLAWNRAQVAAEYSNPKSRLYNDLPGRMDSPWQKVYIRAIELLPKAIDEADSEREIKKLLSNEEKRKIYPDNLFDYMPK